MKPMKHALIRRGSRWALFVCMTSVLVACTVDSNNNTDPGVTHKIDNNAPQADAGGDQSAMAGAVVQVAGSGSDSDGNIVSYAWSRISGPSVSLVNSDSNTVSFTAPEVSTTQALTLRLTVTDDKGDTGSDDVVITVLPVNGNQPPTVSAGQDKLVNVGQDVILNASAGDNDGSIVSYLWTDETLNGPALALSNANTANVSFNAPAVTQRTPLTLRITVADDAGATASDDVIVTINASPQAHASAGDNQAVYPTDLVTLAGSGEDVDGTITGYLWQQVPGQTPAINVQNPQAQSIEFNAPTVTVPTPLNFTLTVTDNNGATATDTVMVTVNPFTILSGTITTAVATQIDSDTNAQDLQPVANQPVSNFQHIPNPVTLGGYVHREGVGPNGPGNTNTVADVEDIYHVNMVPGQAVSLYLGESYFDATKDDSNPPHTEAEISLMLSNDFTNQTYTQYGYVTGSSGVLSLTVPADNVPADGQYLISVVAGSASAYSYVLTVDSSAPLQTNGLSTQQDFVPNEVIVEFKEPASAGTLNVTSLEQRAWSVGMQALGGAPGRSMLLGFGDAAGKALAFKTLGIQQAGIQYGGIQGSVSAPSAANDALHAKIDTISAALALKRRPDVKSVRLNHIYHALAVPNDSTYSQQWHYPLINLPQAWDVTTGSSAVTVAVIDTGILSNHPDIDASRLVDGYDFISSASNAADGNGIDPNPEDPGDGGGVRNSSFHGTHVTGTISANTNNSLGVAGIAWNVNIMPLRVLGVNGGTEYDIEQAIRYAAQLANDSNTLPSHKADVINLSLGGPTSTTSAPQAYKLARAAGVIIIAAAGNNGNSQLSAPAAYNGVVSVSAVTMNKQLASYSNFGSTIDVAAPGGDYNDTNQDGLYDAVWSTIGSDSGRTIQYSYGYAAGTSMAAPHVAGVVALMKSVYPDLTPAIFDTMLANGELTQDLGSAGRDNNFGYGLIDAQKAVTAAAAIGTPDPGVLTVAPDTLNFGSQLTTIDINISNGGSGPLTVTDISENSGGWLSVNPATVDQQGLGRYTVSVNRDAVTQGFYSAAISVVSNGGSVDIPVSMQVFPSVGINNAGPQVIELIDINTQQVVQTQRVLPTDGVYQFSFDNVRFGVFGLRSSSDLDNDGTLCEVGESCGAYPTLDNTASSEIHVDGSSFDINGLDFNTGFSTSGVAQ